MGMLRYNRCLDLYLCPRAVKHRMNVDPASLLPSLPAVSSLRPFPVSLCLSYLPLSLHAQRLPRPQPLYAFLLPFLDKANQRLDWDDGDTIASNSNSSSNSSSNNSSSSSSLLGPGGGARVVAVDALGTYVAAGGRDGCLRVFETMTGRIAAAVLLQQQITAVAFHPSLPILAVAAAEQLLLIALDVPLFDNESQQELTTAAATTAKKKRHADAAAAEEDETEETGTARRVMQEALDLLLVKTATEDDLPDLLKTAEADSLTKRIPTTSSTTTTNGSSSNPYVVDAAVGSSLIGCWQQVSMRHAKAETKAAAKEMQQLQEQQQQQHQKAHEPTLLLRGIKRAVFIMHDSPILKLKWQPKGEKNPMRNYLQN